MTTQPDCRTSRLVLAALMGILAIAGTGCARNTYATRTDTAVVHTTPVQPADGTTVVTEERTVRTWEADNDRPRGVLSTTVHFIGEILALPFRIVGGLLRAIF